MDSAAKNGRRMDLWQPSQDTAYRELLYRSAERFRVPIDDELCERLLCQMKLVLDADRTVNLTAIRNPREAVVKHIVDSMAFYPAYHAAQGRYLDFGTGAGYPGMVLEILEPRPGVLLDSVGKKIVACQRIGDKLGLRDVDYVAERVESYAAERGGCFGVLTARAVAPLYELLEYASPLLEQGGVFIAGKGMLSDEEAEHGAVVAELVGLERVSCETFELPDAMGRRTILVYRKVRQSSVNLPRPVGRAKKRPLWRR